MDNNKNLKELLEKYDKTIEETSKEFIDELMGDSKTYGEVSRKLNLFEKEIMYSSFKTREQKSLDISFFIYVRCILDKEKNDLLLTNRSD